MKKLKLILAAIGCIPIFHMTPMMKRSIAFSLLSAVALAAATLSAAPDPNWPRFTVDDGTVMYFNQKPYPGSVPSAPSLAELDAYFKWRRTPEGDAWAQ